MIKTESAGGVILNPHGRVLVVSQNDTSWSLPKGRIEKGETRIAAAYREIEEETGIKEKKLKFIRKLGSYQRYSLDKSGKVDKSELKKIHMFLFTTRQKKIRPIDPENPEGKWVAKEEVIAILTAPADKKFYISILDKI